MLCDAISLVADWDQANQVVVLRTIAPLLLAPTWVPEWGTWVLDVTDASVGIRISESRGYLSLSVAELMLREESVIEQLKVWAQRLRGCDGKRKSCKLPVVMRRAGLKWRLDQSGCRRSRRIDQVAQVSFVEPRNP